MNPQMHALFLGAFGIFSTSKAYDTATLLMIAISCMHIMICMQMVILKLDCIKYCMAKRPEN